MSNSRLVSPNKSGFTLLELILWLAICSILSLSCISLVRYSNKLVQKANLEDEILLHGRFGLEYIKNEISSADYIIPTYKIKGLDSNSVKAMDFIIVTLKNSNDKNTDQEQKYRYIAYFQNNNDIVRVSVESNSEIPPNWRSFKGHNYLCSNVKDISKTKLDIDNNMIKLHILMEGENVENIEFKSIIYLNSDIKI